jgi:hypothetical protein
LLNITYMKRCPQCGLTKSLSDFYANRTRGDTRQAYCKECSKKRTRKRYADDPASYAVVDKARRKRRQDKMLTYLQGKSCVDCGLIDSRVLEFDHVRGKKVANVSYLFHRKTVELAMIEIAKCDIVCANCHRIRTYTRQDSYRMLG